MKEYLQYIRKLIRSSIKPSARKWFWVIVVAAMLAFLVLFGILRYKMEFSVADSGYIGWLFTARAVIIALISTAIIILTVLVTVGTAIYKREKRLAAEQDSFCIIPAQCPQTSQDPSRSGLISFSPLSGWNRQRTRTGTNTPLTPAMTVIQS